MSDDSTPPAKRTHKVLSPLEKLKAIEEVELGDTKASVARRFNVPESTLRGWMKAKDKIRLAARNSSSGETSVSPSSENMMSGMAGTSKLSSEDQRPRKRIRLEDGVAMDDKAELKVDSASNEPNMDKNHAAISLQQANLLVSDRIAAAANLPFDSGMTLWYSQNRSNSQNLINELQPSSVSLVRAGSANSTMPADDYVEEAAKRSAEAIEQGQNFLEWLESCSHPLISRVKVTQLSALLQSLKQDRQ